jgi:hypothetical protein
MASLPNEKPDQDLAHVIQYAQLASMVVCNARKIVMPNKQRVTLTIAEENELLDFLNGIEERARAAASKLSMVNRFYPLLEQLATGTPGVESPPMEYLAGELEHRPGVSKLLRYYDCVQCAKQHWEDDRQLFDDHILYACAVTGTGTGGIRFGHRTELGLVK